MNHTPIVYFEKAGPFSMQGYRALRESAAWLDLTGRGRLRVSGSDSVRLLHAIASNHIEGLAPGGGCYTFFLDAQGHILADAHVFRFPNHLLLDTAADLRERLQKHIEDYVIMDDVVIEDMTGEAATVAVEGPRSGAILEALAAPVPAEPYAFLEWEGGWVARCSWTGAPGFWLTLPRDRLARLLERLSQTGCEPASLEAAEVVRLEQGKPLFGPDFGEKNLPQETGVPDAVHFHKGCYVGHEIVERIRARGSVRRKLVPLRIEAAAPPEPEAEVVTAGDKPVGRIASARYSPGVGLVVALAQLRLEAIESGEPLNVAGAVARVVLPHPVAFG